MCLELGKLQGWSCCSRNYFWSWMKGEVGYWNKKECCLEKAAWREALIFISLRWLRGHGDQGNKHPNLALLPPSDLLVGCSFAKPTEKPGKFLTLCTQARSWRRAYGKDEYDSGGANGPCSARRQIKGVSDKPMSPLWAAFPATLSRRMYFQSLSFVTPIDITNCSAICLQSTFIYMKLC